MCEFYGCNGNGFGDIWWTDNPIYFSSIDMPYECNANEDIYLEKLGKLHTILDELDTTCVSIIGDWNGDISDPNSQFARHLKLFCLDNGLVSSDEMLLPSNTFTHMSELWLTTSWLDHCLSSGDGHTVIIDIAMLYSTCCSDHIPITVDIAIASIPVLDVPGDVEINLSVNWSKLSTADKYTYYARDIDVHLNAVKVPVDAICCKDTECSNEQHLEALNVFYDGLVGVLTEASK